MAKLLLTASALLTAAAVPLPAKLVDFSGTMRLQQVIPGWGPPTHHAPEQKMDFTGPMAMDVTAMRIKYSQPYGKDGRTSASMDDFSGSGSLFILEPFFNETVCYHTPHGQMKGKTPAQGFQAAAMKLLFGPASQNPTADWTKGEDSTVDGKPCTLYTFTQEGQHFVESVCLHSSGIGLAMNYSSPRGANVSFTLSDFQTPAAKGSTDAPADCVDFTKNSTITNRMANDAQLIAKANEEAGGMWVAEASPVFEGMTLAEAAKRHGTKMAESQLPVSESQVGQVSADAIPDSFDARTKWASCPTVGTIRNQGPCGSCWAFAANEAFDDRQCIHNGPKNYISSIEYMIDCDKKDGGCGGGFLDDAWKFLVNTGVPAETCDPYQHCPNPATAKCTNGTGPAPAPAPAKPATCPTKCSDGSALKTMKAKTAYAVAKPGDVKGMQQEIMTNGPIEVAFFVFSDFQTYKTGVYAKTASAHGPLGGHAVRILGWGTENSTPYWLVANSWSPAWGEKGYFKIRRGTNECGIETTPAAGIPATSAETTIVV